MTYKKRYKNLLKNRNQKQLFLYQIDFHMKHLKLIVIIKMTLPLQTVIYHVEVHHLIFSLNDFLN